MTLRRCCRRNRGLSWAGVGYETSGRSSVREEISRVRACERF
jgi:hypothetical protein